MNEDNVNRAESWKEVGDLIKAIFLYKVHPGWREFEKIVQNHVDGDFQLSDDGSESSDDDLVRTTDNAASRGITVDFSEQDKAILDCTESQVVAIAALPYANRKNRN